MRAQRFGALLALVIVPAVLVSCSRSGPGSPKHTTSAKRPPSSTSAPSPAAARQAPGTFVDVAPNSARIADTRTRGWPVRLSRPDGHSTLHVPVLGHDIVATDGVAAIQLNVTVVDPGASGRLIVYPDGDHRPDVTSASFVRGRSTGTSVVTRVGANGKVAIYNGSAAPTDVAIDVIGYFVAGRATTAGSFTAVTPKQLLSSHDDAAVADGGAAIQLAVGGRDGVPRDGVAAVVLDVTVTGGTRDGSVIAHAAGSARPTVSSLAFAPEQDATNLVISKVGPAGVVTLDNTSSGPARIAVDVLGYYRSGTPSAEGAFVATDPTRAADSRRTGLFNEQLAVRLGTGPLPTINVGSAVMTVTATGATGVGDVVVDPLSKIYDADGEDRPNGSLLNYRHGADTSNLAVGPIGGDGSVFVDPLQVNADLVVDVVGYYLARRGEAAGVVSGRVISESTGKPVSANISIDPKDPTKGSPDPVRTSADGTYHFFDVPPSAGGYAVCVEANLPATPLDSVGFQDQCYRDVPWQPSFERRVPPPKDSTGVRVTAGHETAGVDFALRDGSAVGGTVRNGAGAPLRWIYVQVFDASNRMVGEQRTGVSGTFHIGGLLGRAYHVCFYVNQDDGTSSVGYHDRCYGHAPWNGQAPVPQGATPVRLTVGRTTRGIDATLTKG